MKLWNIIVKNFKILLRTKSSAFVVVVGPLLLVALIALALSNAQEYSLTVGVIAAGEGELTDQFITQLHDSGYAISYYGGVEECEKQIHMGNANICLKLPENFVLENDKVNTIEFYVDQSRMNLVESIISSLSSTVGIKSEEITLSLTQGLVDTVDLTADQLAQETAALGEIKAKVDSVESKTKEIKSKSEESSLGDATAGLSIAKNTVKSIDNSTETLKNETEQLLEDLDEYLDSSEDASSDLKKSYVSLKTVSKNETYNINNATTALQGVLDDVNKKISSTSENIAVITDNANSVQGEVGSIELKISEVEGSIQATKDKIDSLKITSAASIVSPVEVSVNPILSSTNRSIFMFPYFLTLIILFVGIMLASTLVVMEKKSRAFFKTFTAPTSGMHHLLGGYLTNITILFSQLAVILTAALYYLKIALLENIIVTVVILFLSVSFFVLLGTLIGHLFKSQEGTTIASISVGSLFLFLSNVILPVESFPKIIRTVISSTPYMLSAELIKESVLFNVGFSGLSKSLALLGAYVLVTALLVVVFQKLSSTWFFEGSANRNVLRKPHVTKDNCFRLQDGTLIKNKEELLRALKKISEEDFGIYVNKGGNEIALWLKDAFRDVKLARRMKKAATREEMIGLLSNSQSLQEAVREQQVKQTSTQSVAVETRSWKLPRLHIQWDTSKPDTQEESSVQEDVQIPSVQSQQTSMADSEKKTTKRKKSLLRQKARRNRRRSSEVASPSSSTSDPQL